MIHILFLRIPYIVGYWYTEAHSAHSVQHTEQRTYDSMHSTVFIWTMIDERVYNTKMKLRLSCSGFYCCWIHKVCTLCMCVCVCLYISVSTVWLANVRINFECEHHKISSIEPYLFSHSFDCKNRSKATHSLLNIHFIFLYSPVIEKNKIKTKQKIWCMLCLMLYFHSNDFDSTNVVLLQLL